MTPKLDRIDLNILAQLQRNGRISNVDLADAVGAVRQPVPAARESGWRRRATSPAMARR